MKSYRYFWELIKYRPWSYGTDIVNITLHFVFGTVFGLIFKWYFNGLTAADGIQLTPWQAVWAHAAGTFLVMATLFIAMYAFVHFTQYGMGLMIRNMLVRLLERPGAEPLPRDEKGISFASGKVISTLRDDTDAAVHSLILLDDVVGLLATAAIAFAIMFSISVRVTLGTFIPLIIVVLIANRLALTARAYRKKSRAATSEVTGMIGDMFNAVQALKTAHAEKRIIARFRKLNAARRRAMIWDKVLTQLIRTLSSGTLAVGVGLILLLAAQQMLAGAFTIGDFALFAAYLWPVLELMRRGSDLITGYKQVGVAFERMEEVMQGAEQGAVVAHHPIYMKAPPPPIVRPSKMAGDHFASLRVEGLSYTFGAGENGIKDISFVIPRGSFTVVTGRIGAGKTTLLELLLGLRPAASGTIYWNDLPVVDPGRWMVPPRAAYAGQAARLFSDNVRDNILLGMPATDLELEKALSAAVLEEDLAQMPDGLQTMVGPRGVRLSGGQIQRTAAARLFVRQAELLLIDDLSSALDVQTEQQLWERLFAEAGGALSCLVVSHRPAVLARADQILILEDGRLVDRGTLHELLERSAVMQRLWHGGDDIATG